MKYICFGFIILVGKKKKALAVKDKSQPSWSNCSASARNLRKCDLGAVIFGCKNNTFDECYSRLLFGLPAPHFAYVRNIIAGLPLFLFNYSDRNLHGIFEAVSPGQMNINPYGWMGDGSEYTPYPAQVRVQIRMQCQPLSEVQFKPIIAENYYEYNHFWFELDRAQAHKLISLFSSSPVAGHTSLSQNTSRCLTTFNALPTTIRASVSEVYIGHSDQSNMQWDSWDAPGLGRESQNLEAPVGMDAAEKYEQELLLQKPNSKHSYASVVSNMSVSLPQKKWSSLFKTSTTSDTIKENEEFAGSVPLGTSFETLPSAGTREEEEYPKRVESDLNLPRSDESNMGWDSFVTLHLDGESQPSEGSSDNNSTKIYKEELVHPNPDSDCFHSSTVTKEMTVGDNYWKNPTPSVMAGVHSEEGCFSEAATVLEVKSSNTQSVIDKLIQEVEALKASHLKQIWKISSLEQELGKSRVEIQQLKSRCSVLESGPLSSTGNAEEETSWW